MAVLAPPLCIGLLRESSKEGYRIGPFFLSLMSQNRRRGAIAIWAKPLTFVTWNATAPMRVRSGSRGAEVNAGAETSLASGKANRFTGSSGNI